MNNLNLSDSKTPTTSSDNIYIPKPIKINTPYSVQSIINNKDKFTQIQDLVNYPTQAPSTTNPISMYPPSKLLMQMMLPFGFPYPNLFSMVNEQTQKMTQTRNIGTLTEEERKQKIQKYLEKKSKRKYKGVVRYSVRKNLALSRERDQGRFVKQKNKIAFPFF